MPRSRYLQIVRDMDIDGNQESVLLGITCTID
jgi:hypothetical protein